MADVAGGDAAWQALAARLLRDRLPLVTVEGDWTFRHEEGIDAKSFRAVHGPVGHWRVEQPIGEPWLVSDPEGQVWHDDGEPVLEPADACWGYELSGLAVQPAAWLSDPGAWWLLEGPEPDTVAGRACERVNIRYPADRKQPITLWIDSELPLVLRMETRNYDDPVPETVEEMTVHSVTPGSDAQAMDWESSTAAAVLRQARASRWTELTSGNVPQDGTAKGFVAALEKALSVEGEVSVDARLLSLRADGGLFLQLRLNSPEGWADGYLDRRPVTELPYTRMLRHSLSRSTGQWRYTFDYSGDLDPDSLHEPMRRIATGLDQT